MKSGCILKGRRVGQIKNKRSKNSWISENFKFKLGSNGAFFSTSFLYDAYRLHLNYHRKQKVLQRAKNTVQMQSDFLSTCVKITVYTLFPSSKRRLLCKKLCSILRGGVEDTRLEAKAKDTKNIQSQGQPFQRQTLSRPRPRTKDTAASVFQKKKVFKKAFQGISNL